MKIQEIKFPDGCDLKGWDRIVFQRRIHDALEGSRFSICDLDRCRYAVLGDVDAKELANELHAFHCVSYEDMHPADAAALIDKAAEYVGIGVTMQPPQTKARKVVRFGGVLAMAGVSLLRL